MPLTYAGDVYALTEPRAECSACARLYRPQPRAAAVAGHRWPRWRWSWPLAGAAGACRAYWSRGANAGVNRSQALNIWIIQIVVAIGPPLGALVFTVYLKTDWGISLFFLIPLALVAIPRCGCRGWRCSISPRSGWSITLAALAASPYIAAREMADNPNGASGYGARSELARELTQAWHQRFHSRWAVVAGTTEIGEPMTFYSPDHPATVHARRTLVVGADVAGGGEAARLHRHLRYDRRATAGVRGVDGGQRGRCRAARHDDAALLQRACRPATSWKIYIVPPAE